MTTVGVRCRQLRLQRRAMVPADTALRITALDPKRSSAGLAHQGTAAVAVVAIDVTCGVRGHDRRKASC